MSDPDRVSRRDLFRARFSRRSRAAEREDDPPGRARLPWAPLPEALAEALVETAGVAAWESLLEVGPGDGAVARAAVARSAFAVVAGSVPDAVAHGRARAALEAHRAPGDALPFAPGEFDRVIAPFGTGRPTLTELARVVRPGGTVLVAGWPPESVVGRAARLAGAPALDWGDPDRARAALDPFCEETASHARQAQLGVADVLALALAAGASREEAEALLAEAGDGPRLTVGYVVTKGLRTES